MNSSPQSNYYHNKTTKDIEKANKFINVYEIFEKNKLDLPIEYKNVYSILTQINRKPTRKYVKKIPNQCIVINRGLNRITFD